MKFKTTITLVAIAVIIILFFVLTTSSNNSATPASSVSTKQGTPIPLKSNVSSSDINKITIIKDQKMVVLTKKGNNWLQTRPVVFAVQSYQASNIIKDIASLRYVEKFIPGQNKNMPTLKAVGLKNPKAIVTLTSNTGSVTIKIGTHPIGGHGYVMIKGDKHVYVVSDALHKKILDHSAKDWRKTAITAPKASAASFVSLQRDKNSVVLNKYKGRWYIGKKDNQRASKETISTLLNSLGRVYIDKFIDDNPKSLATYGLKNPVLTVTVKKPVIDSSADNTESQKDTKAPTKKTAKPKFESYTLRIGSPASLSEKNKKYFASWSKNGKGQKVVFTVNASSFDDLNKSVNDLRDSSVVITPSDEVQALTIKRDPAKEIHIIKGNNGNFVFGNPKPAYKLDNKAVHALISQLTSAKASGYEPDFKANRKPVATISIKRRGASGTETLHVYKQANGKGYLTVRNSEPVAYEVSSTSLAKLFKPELSLRDKTIARIKSDKITNVTLKRGDGVTFNFTKTVSNKKPSSSQKSPVHSKATWELTGHKQFEQDSFKNLLDALGSLRIKKWLSDKTQTPGKNWIVLTVKTKAAKPIVIKVNPENGHGIISSDKGTFIVTDHFAKQLKAEYRDRTLLDLHLDDIQKVTVTASESDSHALTISRNKDGSYKLEGYVPKGQQLSQSKAADIFDTLAGLKAHRFTPQHNFGAATVTLSLTTQSGDTLNLVCYSKSGEVGIAGAGAKLTGTINGRKVSRWCVLSQDNIAKLTSKVLEDASKNSPGK